MMKRAFGAATAPSPQRIVPPVYEYARCTMNLATRSHTHKRRRIPWEFVLLWGSCVAILFVSNLRDAFTVEVVPAAATSMTAGATVQDDNNDLTLWMNGLWNPVDEDENANNHSKGNNDSQKKESLVPVVDRHINTSSLTTMMTNTTLDEHGLDMDTTVIITSSLIPTHPSIAIIRETISSLKLLHGLSPRAPIYITVDGLPEEDDSEENRADGDDRTARLNGYIHNLRHAYRKQSNIHVLVSDYNRHIAGSIKWAFDTAPATSFYYMVQHDFPFAKPIDHTNIRKSMVEHPTTLSCVRFNYRVKNSNARCGAGQANFTAPSIYNVNGLEFYLTVKWSDNNHIASRDYYQGVWNLLNLTTTTATTEREYRNRLKQPVEWFLMGRVRENCTSGWGQWLYGRYKGPAMFLRHLDGRNRDFVVRRPKQK